MTEHHDIPERAEGVYAPTGETRSFKRSWGGYRFTDEEVGKLLAGESIEIFPTSQKTGKKYSAIGKLDEGEFEGKSTFSFVLERFGVPLEWGGAEFTAEERAALNRGDAVEVKRTSAKGNDYTAKLTYADGNITAEFV